MDNDCRIVIAFCIAGMSCLIRLCFLRCTFGVSTIIMNWIFNEYSTPTNYGRLFRSFGWTFTNTSVALFISALVLHNSHLNIICINADGIHSLTAVFCFVVFTILYYVAIKLRYVLLEAAETHGNYRWIFGGLSWTLGWTMLYSMSWLI